MIRVFFGTLGTDAIELEFVPIDIGKFRKIAQKHGTILRENTPRHSHALPTRVAGEVMNVFLRIKQLKICSILIKADTLHHPFLLERLDGSIDCHSIDIFALFAKFLLDVFDPKRGRRPRKDRQYRKSRNGDFEIRGAEDFFNRLLLFSHWSHMQIVSYYRCGK